MACPRGGEDRVRQRRCHRRHPGLADPGRQPALGRDQFHRGRGGLCDAQHLVVVEVALHHGAVLHADVAVECERQAEHHRPLHLRAAGVRVDVGAAVEHDVGVRHPGLAVFHARLEHRRDVGIEALVDGEAESDAFRPRFVPRRQLAHPLDDVAQTAEVQFVAGHRLLAGRLQLAARREHAQAVLDGIPSHRGRHLVGEHVGREGVEDVAHGPQPADPDAGADAGELHALVVHRVGQVGEAHVQFPGGGVARLRREHAGDGRERRALQPRRRSPGVVDHRPVVLGTRGVEVVVADIVLAQPLHAHRPLEPLRQLHGLQGEVRLRLASEGTAEEGRRHRDLVGRHSQIVGDEPTRGLRILQRRIDGTAIFGDVRHGDRRFHRCMGEEGRLIGGLQFGAAGLECRVDVALGGTRHQRARLLEGVAQRLAQHIAVEVLVGASGPLDVELPSDANRGPGVLGNHRHPTQGREDRPGARCRVEDLDAHQAGFVRRLVGDVLHPAAKPRTAHDHRGRHVGQAEVGAERALAAGDVGRIDVGHALADEAVLRLLFQRRVARDGQGRGVAGKFAVAESAAAGLVHDLVVDRGHRVDVDSPAFGAGLAQHEPRTGARGAQPVVVQQDALRAVGVLVAVLGIALGLHHGDPGPVGVQFVRDHLGQRGADALAHLRAVGRDPDGAVRIEGEEEVGLERAGGDVQGRGFPCRQARAEHEHPRHTEKVTAGEVGGDVGDRVHRSVPPVARLPAASWMAARIRT